LVQVVVSVEPLTLPKATAHVARDGFVASAMVHAPEVVVVLLPMQVCVVQLAVYPSWQPQVPRFGVPLPMFSVISPPGPMHNEFSGRHRFFTRAQSQPSGWNLVSPALAWPDLPTPPFPLHITVTEPHVDVEAVRPRIAMAADS